MSEVQKSLLGSMLDDYTATLPALVKHGISERHFTGVNRTAFKIISEIASSEGCVVQPVIRRRLMERTGMNSTDAEFYIASLSDACLVTEYADHYAAELVQEFKKRIVKSVPAELERQVTVEESISVLEKALMELTSTAKVTRDMAGIVDAVKTRWEGVRRGEITGGVLSRFGLIQQAGGYKDYTIIAAAPGQGKSTLMTNEVLYQAKAGYKVGVVSLEMSDEMLVERLLADELDISAYGLNNGQCSAFTYERAMSGIDTLKRHSNIVINDRPMGINELCSAIELMKIQHDIDLCYVDYLQLISNTERGISDNSRVGMYSNRLMGLRKKLSIPIVALSQLSRDHLKNNRRPAPHDLRDSGSLEQDAAMIVLISEAKEGDVDPATLEANRDKDSGRVNLAYVHVAKNRHGPTAYDVLRKEFSRFRFAELDASGESDQPEAEDDLL